MYILGLVSCCFGYIICAVFFPEQLDENSSLFVYPILCFKLYSELHLHISLIWFSGYHGLLNLLRNDDASSSTSSRSSLDVITVMHSSAKVLMIRHCCITCLCNLNLLLSYIYETAKHMREDYPSAIKVHHLPCAMLYTSHFSPKSSFVMEHP